MSKQIFDKKVQDFKHGVFSVACQVGNMIEGFDDNSVNLCVNYPTRSFVKEEQTGGRVIRLNGPDKVAFVIDTIFRAVNDNSQQEDIAQTLYLIIKNKQVLFQDMVGGAVLGKIPARNSNTRQINKDNAYLIDGELFSNTNQLMDLFAAQNIDYADYMSANELCKEYHIDYTRINMALKSEYESQENRFRIAQIRKGYQYCIGIHKDDVEEFINKLKKRNFKKAVILVQTKEEAQNTVQTKIITSIVCDTK